MSDRFDHMLSTDSAPPSMLVLGAVGILWLCLLEGVTYFADALMGWPG